MANIKESTTEKKAFKCPHCSHICVHDFYYTFAHRIPGIPETINLETLKICEGQQIFPSAYVKAMFISKCQGCNKLIIWVNKEMVYPDSSTIEDPNSDLEDDIKDLYNEARSIVNKSPRGAAALLRLCLEKLCIQLGCKQNSINDAIGELVKKGLNPKIQKSLDYIRIVGNESVHPGQINLNENPEGAIKLFSTINFIADQMISLPKRIDQSYDELPQDKRNGIANRDKNNL